MPSLVRTSTTPKSTTAPRSPARGLSLLKRVLVKQASAARIAHKAKSASNPYTFAPPPAVDLLPTELLIEIWSYVSTFGTRDILAASHVSAWWYHNMSSVPSLWSTIVCRISYSPHLYSLLFERSAGLPVSLAVGCTFQGSSIARSLVEHPEYASQVKRLVFWSSKDDQNDLGPLSLPQLAWPLLEEVSVISIPAEEDEYDDAPRPYYEPRPPHLQRGPLEPRVLSPWMLAMDLDSDGQRTNVIRHLNLEGRVLQPDIWVDRRGRPEPVKLSFGFDLDTLRIHNTWLGRSAFDNTLRSIRGVEKFYLSRLACARNQERFASSLGDDTSATGDPYTANMQGPRHVEIAECSPQAVILVLTSLSALLERNTRSSVSGSGLSDGGVRELVIHPLAIIPLHEDADKLGTQMAVAFARFLAVNASSLTSLTIRGEAWVLAPLARAFAASGILISLKSLSIEHRVGRSYASVPLQTLNRDFKSIGANVVRWLRRIDAHGGKKTRVRLADEILLFVREDRKSDEDERVYSELCGAHARGVLRWV